MTITHESDGVKVKGQCHAICIAGDGIVRCKDAITDRCFCWTHWLMFKEGRLARGVEVNGVILPQFDAAVMAFVTESGDM